jgi:LPXTG-motif cell wall-anchored protein
MAYEEASPEVAGSTRRDFLKKTAVVGGAVWAVPAVQMVSMTAAHADSPSAPSSGGNPGTPSNPGNPQNPPGNPVTPPGGEVTPLPPATENAPAVQPAVQPAVAPENVAVMGTQVQGTLPKTGPDFPVSSTVALGAGLIAAGGAAVAASRRKPAADGTAASGRHSRTSESE